ncbi:hypothetical protein [Xanthomonas arboricola]|uniref:hypothetical protein n=1 Tax=Xanthomonas arboricola TaxID=56448 RepID=UPI003EC11A89
MSQTIVIASESDAWALLAHALVDGQDLDISHIAFEGWPKLAIHVEGPGLHATLPGRYLGALLEYQEGVKKVFSYVKYKEYGVRRLKRNEIEEFEVTFSIDEGSSQFLADMADKFQALGSQAISKMTGKQIAITVCVLALMYFSEAGFSSWLSSKEKSEQTEITKALVDALAESHHTSEDKLSRQMALLKEARRQSRYGRLAYDSADEAHSKLVSSMNESDDLHIGSARLSGKELKEATSSPRTKSETFSVEGAAILTGVDSSVASGYVVDVRMEGGEVIAAKIEENRLTDEEMASIKNAVFSRKPVWVHVDGKTRRQKVREAFIFSARELTRAEKSNLPRALGGTK